MEWCCWGAVAGIAGIIIAIMAYRSAKQQLEDTLNSREALIVACRVIARSGTALSKEEYDVLKRALSEDHLQSQ